MGKSHEKPQESIEAWPNGKAMGFGPMIAGSTPATSAIEGIT